MNHPDSCKPPLFLPTITNPLTPNRRYLHCPATGHFYCLTTGSLYQVIAPIIPLSTNMQLLLQKRDVFLTVQPGLFCQPQIYHNTEQSNKKQKSKPRPNNDEPPAQNNNPLPPATENKKISLNKHVSNLIHEKKPSAQGTSTSFTAPQSHNSPVNGEKKEEVNLKRNQNPPIQSNHLTTLVNQEKLPHIKSEINLSVGASSTSSTCTQSKGAQTKKKKNKASKPKKKSKVPSLKTSSINSMKSSVPCKENKLTVALKKDTKTISPIFLNVKKNSTTSTTLNRHRTRYPYNPCVNPKKKSYLYYVSTLPTKTQQIQSLQIELWFIRGKPLFKLKKGPHVPSSSTDDEESTDELDQYFGSNDDTRFAATNKNKRKTKKERKWYL